MNSFASPRDNLHLGSPSDFLHGPNCSIDIPFNFISLESVFNSSHPRSRLALNRDSLDHCSTSNAHDFTP
nr:hypothetical protein Q903MT_gene6171 [Picea sitchensis]